MRHQCLTERHLQVLWFEQRYFHNLLDTDGVPVTVISPGMWNTEAGPDFLKAHLQIGDTECHGDIEIHVNPGDWYHHSHHKDPRYNNVVFHLSLYPSEAHTQLVTVTGRVLRRGALLEALTIPVSRLSHLIDLDLYPYRRCQGSGRCAALFSRMPQKDITSLLTSATLSRLEIKHYKMDNLSQTKGLLGIATALGYKNNSCPFRDVFLHLSPLHDASEETLLAISLGLLGFFEGAFPGRWEASTLYQTLRTCWNNNPLQERYKVSLDHIRPLNHPVRRLAYLAKLLKDPIAYDLENTIQQIWLSSWQRCTSKRHLGTLFQTLMDVLPTYQDTYWNRHYTFEETPSESPLPLLGTPIKREIVTNVFLPLVYHGVREREDEHELHAFVTLLQTLKAETNEKAEYLRHRLFDDDKDGSLDSIAGTQGAYQLHHDYCSFFEASCDMCPFKDRLQIAMTTTFSSTSLQEKYTLL